MKKILLIVCLAFCLSPLFAQTVSNDDFRSIMKMMKENDYQKLFDESSRVLKGTEKDTSELRAGVVYVNIFSAAALVANLKMSYKDLEKNIRKYQGQKVMMPVHKVTENELGEENKTNFTSNDTVNKAFTTATDPDGTLVYCFETFLFNHKINPADYKDSYVRCGGILDKIVINNPNSILWVVDLTIKDAVVKKMAR